MNFLKNILNKGKLFKMGNGNVKYEIVPQDIAQPKDFLGHHFKIITAVGKDKETALYFLNYLCESENIPIPERFDKNYFCGTVRFDSQIKLTPVFFCWENDSVLASVYILK